MPPILGCLNLKMSSMRLTAERNEDPDNKFPSLQKVSKGDLIFSKPKNLQSSAIQLLRSPNKHWNLLFLTSHKVPGGRTHVIFQGKSRAP